MPILQVAACRSRRWTRASPSPTAARALQSLPGRGLPLRRRRHTLSQRRVLRHRRKAPLLRNLLRPLVSPPGCARDSCPRGPREPPRSRPGSAPALQGSAAEDPEPVQRSARKRKEERRKREGGQGPGAGAATAATTAAAQGPRAVAKPPPARRRRRSRETGAAVLCPKRRQSPRMLSDTAGSATGRCVEDLRAWTSTAALAHTRPCFCTDPG